MRWAAFHTLLFLAKVCGHAAAALNAACGGLAREAAVFLVLDAMDGARGTKGRIAAEATDAHRLHLASSSPSIGQPAPRPEEEAGVTQRVTGAAAPPPRAQESDGSAGFSKGAEVPGGGQYTPHPLRQGPHGF